MNLIVDYDRLKDIGTNTCEKEVKIQESLVRIQKILNDLDLCWKGKDCDEFLISAEDIIDNEKEKAKRIKVLGEVITTVSENYKKKDYDWLNKLKKEGIDQ